MHRDIVYDCPKGVELIGHSPRCEVQGMYAKNRLITIQGHPEFTKEIVSSIIDARESILGPDVVADGRARAGREHEGLGVLGRAVWRVLLARRV